MGFAVCAFVATVIWRRRDQPWPCLMGKHEAVLAHAKGEIFLRCVNCGRRTSGVEVAVRRPVQS